MKKGDKTKTTRDSLVEALEEQSIGKPAGPTLPLVGSENVPITEEEEKDDFLLKYGEYVKDCTVIRR